MGIGVFCVCGFWFLFIWGVFGWFGLICFVLALGGGFLGGFVVCKHCLAEVSAFQRGRLVF